VAALIEVLYWTEQVRPLNLSESLILNFYAIPSIWRNPGVGDCILIENNKAMSVFYEKTHIESHLDFLSLSNQSQQDLKIIILLLTSGGVGMSIFSLVDQIFESDFVDIRYGMKRIEFSLSKMAKILPFQRKDNWITVTEIPQKCIFPKLEWVNDVDFLRLRKFNSNFTLHDIETVLKVSSSKARRLRSNWVQKYGV